MQLTALRKSRDTQSSVHPSMTRRLTRRRDNLGQAPGIGPKAQLAAALIEELAQPLTAMLLNIDTARLVTSDGANGAGEVPQILSDMARDAERARQIIESLRDHLIE